MTSFSVIPHDIFINIVVSDPQTWRAMRLASTYYHQLLSWSAYVDKFTVVRTNNTSHTFPARVWTLDGKLHREYDLPAVIYHNGTRVWCKYGRYHRGHGRPAIIHDCGTCNWYRHECPRRDHGRPTVIYAIGVRVWQKVGTYCCDERP
jgi:hypothetical protein